MKTIEVSDHTKQKLEEIASRRNRSESEVLDELVSGSVVKRRSAKGLLKGRVTDPLTDEDFEAVHQEMLKRYGQD